jgi:hypothetical protein
MPRTMVLDAVRSFTRSLILLWPVSLVCLTFEVTTGGCRVLAMKTNAAGLSMDSLPQHPITDSWFCSSYLGVSLNAESTEAGSAS